MRAFILKSDMRKISQKFRTGTGEDLRDNIKILFHAEVAYSPLHGLSLQIIDIDPTYTLGDLERERQDCIKRLQQEGLYELNKSRHFSLAPKSIAVISSNTSKGFEDFLHTLAKASPDIHFKIELFGAALQGSDAPASIIHQLELIRSRCSEFDAVAIIRGGGGDVGLSCYNDYSLAAAVSRFPIPVFTGVGHKANETVVELVSYGAGITPTAVGEIFVQRCLQFLQSINLLSEKLKQITYARIKSNQELVNSASLSISRMALNLLHGEDFNLSESAHRLIRHANHSINFESKQIQSVCQNMHHYSTSVLSAQRQYLRLRAMPVIQSGIARSIKTESDLLDSIVTQLPIKTKWHHRRITDELEKLETIVRLNNPEALFEKGFSITKRNGKILRNLKDIQQGDEIVTQFINGTATSIIQKIHIQDE